MITRITLAEPGPQNGDCSSTGLECAAMRGSINAPRETRNDRHAAPGQISGNHRSRVQPVGRTSSRTYNRHAGLVETDRPGSRDIKRNRRVVNLPQQRWVDTVVEYEYL